MRKSIVLGMAILLLVAVALLVQQPVAANGNGAVFVDNTFRGFETLDGSTGEYCSALAVPPPNGPNDFIRLGPEGSLFLHLEDHAATVNVIYQGITYAGVGHLTVNAKLPTLQPFMGQATAMVSDADGNVGQALCVFAGDSSGTVQVILR